MFTLGIDYGTNSVRALIVDVDSGQEVATAVHPYQRGEAGIILDAGNPRVARQHPGDYLVGLEKAVKGAISQAKRQPGFSASKVAGLGVDIAPTAQTIAALEKPAEWLLQRMVTYAPVMATPDGPAKAEIRLIFAGDGTGMPKLINNLVRLTKGAMHGVDFNKGRTWVGASAGFHPPA